MRKVLLTGGSGFLAAHILDTLLDHGHDVVVTVRREEQGQQILAGHKAGSRLAFAVVESITDGLALKQVFETNGPFDSVIHTASPFTMSFDDPVRDVLDPAIRGTTTILDVIRTDKKSSVRRVVLTSSFAAMINPRADVKVYDESSWNPITWDEAVANRRLTYAASKALAEKAAWEFIETHKPAFDLVVINPPLVFGPVKNHLPGSDKVNTSNQRILDAALGKFQSGNLPPTGVWLWVDVRDVALLHVRAMEAEDVGGKRLLVTAGHFSNKSLIDAIRDTRPDLEAKLPTNPVDDTPENVYGFDNAKASSLLQADYRSFSTCIRDTIDSMV